MNASFSITRMVKFSASDGVETYNVSNIILPDKSGDEFEYEVELIVTVNPLRPECSCDELVSELSIINVAKSNEDEACRLDLLELSDESRTNVAKLNDEESAWLIFEEESEMTEGKSRRKITKYLM